MKTLLAVAGACFTGLIATAQNVPTIRVGVEEVQIHATVTNSAGQYVRELRPDYFAVQEDGVPQTITGFSADDTPLSIAIVFDVGGTMKDNLLIAREGALGFLNAGRLDNEYFLVEFNNKASVTEDVTQDSMKLRDHSRFLNPTADKAPYDALFMSLDKLRGSQSRRNVVLVLTTGGTMKNEHSAAQVRNLARQLDAQIFSVDFPSDFNVSGDFNGKASAADIVEPLGGENFVATSAVDYLNICRKIAVGLRNQYELSYRSTNTARDGKYRRVQVKLHLPKGAPELFIQARDGYYADVP